MILKITKIGISNPSLKVASVLFGIAFWLFFGATHVGTLKISVPLSFYGANANRIAKAPEQLTVTMSGVRSDLWTLDLNNLAVHIDADQLSNGENVLEPSAATLFLPATIKLVHWAPSNPVVIMA